MGKSVIITLLTLLLFVNPAFSQGGWSNNVVFRAGIGIAGVNVAVCQPLATTAAAVTSNLVTFTMSSNPQTAGFVQGMQIQSSGFTGADTYLNAGTVANNTMTGGLTILSVTSSQIIATLVHANASASSNGAILQLGNSVTSCAGLSLLYTNSSLGTLSTNPIVTDGFGNYGFWSTPGQYFVQYYGPTVTTVLTYVTVPGVGTFTGAIGTDQVAFGSSPNVVGGTNGLEWDGSTLLALQATTPATNISTVNSPTFSICGNYYSAGSLPDCFLFNDVVTTNGTLTVTHTGLINPAVSLPGNLAVGSDINAAGLSVGIAGINILNSGPLNLAGSGSGSAKIQAAAAQGSPNPIQLPLSTGTAAYCLQTDGGSPQQTSWGKCVLGASLTTSAASSDNVTITGMTSSGHCSLTPTNATASGLAAVPYISTKTTNQITVTHSVTASATFDILCTPY